MLSKEKHVKKNMKFEFFFSNLTFANLLLGPFCVGQTFANLHVSPFRGDLLSRKFTFAKMYKNRENAKLSPRETFSLRNFLPAKLSPRKVVISSVISSTLSFKLLYFQICELTKSKMRVYLRLHFIYTLGGL